MHFNNKHTLRICSANCHPLELSLHADKCFSLLELLVFRNNKQGMYRHMNISEHKKATHILTSGCHSFREHYRNMKETGRWCENFCNKLLFNVVIFSINKSQLPLILNLIPHLALRLQVWVFIQIVNPQPFKEQICNKQKRKLH